MTKLQLPNLHQSIVNTFFRIASAAVTTTTSFELTFSHARVTSLKFTKQDSGLIIKKTWNECNIFPWWRSDFSDEAVPNRCPDLNYQTVPCILHNFNNMHDTLIASSVSELSPAHQLKDQNHHQNQIPVADVIPG